MCWSGEIMLQQTRVAAALPYYQRFIQQLPDIRRWPPARRKSCTSSGRGWAITAGCAICNRAAQLVCQQYGGSSLPTMMRCWLCPASANTRPGPLPPSGLGWRCLRVDGNVLRVFARLYNDPAL